LAIRGIEIGKLIGICEVAVQTRPEIIIWAFTHTFQCKVWRLHNYVDPVVCSQRYVCRSGILHDSYCIDESGDVVMADAQLVPHVSESLRFSDETEMGQSESFGLTSYDGNSSGFLKREFPKALALENDVWIDCVDVRACSKAWYDADGNVVGWYPIRQRMRMGSECRRR